MPNQVLGAKRRHTAGFSSSAAGAHQGFVFGCDVVQVMTFLAKIYQAWSLQRMTALRFLGLRCRRSMKHASCDAGYAACAAAEGSKARGRQVHAPGTRRRLWGGPLWCPGGLYEGKVLFLTPVLALTQLGCRT